MKILLLNCSFRVKKLSGESNNSNVFLSYLQAILTGEIDRKELIRYKDYNQLIEIIKKIDTLVIAAPLYVDGFPGQVVDLLEKLYDRRKELPNKLKVHAITNMGFYESSQMQIQLQILKNFCEKAGCIYGGSLAIGAGELIGQLKNTAFDKGPNKNMGQGMKRLAFAINKGEKMQDFYAQPKFIPRFLYISIANHMFKKALKALDEKQKR